MWRICSQIKYRYINNCNDYPLPAQYNNGSREAQKANTQKKQRTTKITSIFFGCILIRFVVPFLIQNRQESVRNCVSTPFPISFSFLCSLSLFNISYCICVKMLQVYPKLIDSIPIRFEECRRKKKMKKYANVGNCSNAMFVKNRWSCMLRIAARIYFALLCHTARSHEIMRRAHAFSKHKFQIQSCINICVQQVDGALLWARARHPKASK